MPTVSKDVDTAWNSSFNDFIAEVEREGGKVVVNSGRRSAERQADMIKNPAKYGIKPGTPIAKPGQSDHQHGNAIDMDMDSKTRAIARRLAPKYGIRNDIANDPVHWYIPKDAAAKGSYSPGVDLAVGEAHTQPLPLIDRMEVLAQMLNPQGLRPDTNVDTSAAVGGAAAVGGEPNLPEPVVAEGAPVQGGTITAPADIKGFTAEQVKNASVLASVGRQRGLSERAVQIAIATAMQESGLRNVNHGDRDSLGLFQQRPSQGWGTEAQVQDPTYAANKFYDGLTKVKGWEQLPLTVAAQKVQRSAFPDAYAKHESKAAALARQLLGGN